MSVQTWRTDRSTLRSLCDVLRHAALAAAIVGISAAQAPAATPATAKRPAEEAAGNKPAAKKPTPETLPPLEKASWIWADLRDEVCQLRTPITLEKAPSAASILITADNGYELYINGAKVGEDIGPGADVWGTIKRYDITSRLARGKNAIGIRGTDLGGERGVVAAVRIELQGGPPLEIVTDAAWHVTRKGDPLDHSHPEFVEGPEWGKATVVGPMGVAPWGKLACTGPATGGRRQTGPQAATGFLHCQNVRFTRKTKADWEQVRAIRVLGGLALTTRSSHSHIVHAGHQTVELGSVPLAPDGSFSIEVPADVPLALQAVDAEGRSELNEMSWIYVRPGEQRSCIGCHHSRGLTPPARGEMSLALRARPLRLLGQGQAHRFRGNNSGVTGMMDLQFERFRETASLNRHTTSADPSATGKEEVAAEIQRLLSGPEPLKVSAAQRLGIFRDRAAAPALAVRLQGSSREVRAAAAWALGRIGDRSQCPSFKVECSMEAACVTRPKTFALRPRAPRSTPSPWAGRKTVGWRSVRWPPRRARSAALRCSAIRAICRGRRRPTAWS